MTLILTMGNKDQFIQISDRRLTFNRKLFDDESNKAGVFIYPNVRLAFGFTGLAKTLSGFIASDWLLENIEFSCKKTNNIVEVLENLKNKASFDFENLPSLKQISIKEKSFSVIFSGYLYNFDPPLAVCAILSNTINFPSVQREFVLFPFNEKRPLVSPFSFIQRVGYYFGMKDVDVESLRKLLEKGVDRNHIIDKAVTVMTNISDRQESKGKIGKQLSAITIPRDINNPPIAGYHSGILSASYYLPDLVTYNGEASFLMKGFSIISVDKNPAPLAYPKWPQKRKCPCGSGNLYKNCHGKKL